MVIVPFTTRQIAKLTLLTKDQLVQEIHNRYREKRKLLSLDRDSFGLNENSRVSRIDEEIDALDTILDVVEQNELKNRS